MTESESFAVYMERAETFFTANDIPDRKKTPVFLSVIRGSTHGLLCNLVVLTSPKDKSFEEIVEVLKAHFEPKSIILLKVRVAQGMEAAHKNAQTLKSP